MWRDLGPVEWLIGAWTGGLPMMQPGLWLIPKATALRAGPWDEHLSLIDDFAYVTRVLLAARAVRFCEGARLYYRSGNPHEPREPAVGRGVGVRAAVARARDRRSPRAGEQPPREAGVRRRAPGMGLRRLPRGRRWSLDSRRARRRSGDPALEDAGRRGLPHPRAGRRMEGREAAQAVRASARIRPCVSAQGPVGRGLAPEVKILCVLPERREIGPARPAAREARARSTRDREVAGGRHAQAVERRSRTGRAVVTTRTTRCTASSRGRALRFRADPTVSAIVVQRPGSMSREHRRACARATYHVLKKSARLLPGRYHEAIALKLWAPRRVSAPHLSGLGVRRPLRPSGRRPRRSGVAGGPAHSARCAGWRPASPCGSERRPSGCCGPRPSAERATAREAIGEPRGARERPRRRGPASASSRPATSPHARGCSRRRMPSPTPATACVSSADDPWRGRPRPTTTCGASGRPMGVERRGRPRGAAQEVRLGRSAAPRTRALARGFGQGPCRWRWPRARMPVRTPSCLRAALKSQPTCTTEAPPGRWRRSRRPAVAPASRTPSTSRTFTAANQTIPPAPPASTRSRAASSEPFSQGPRF